MNMRLKGEGGSFRAKVVAVATALTVSGVAAFVPLVAVADHTTAHTIEQLTAQINALQAQLLALSGGSASAPAAGGAEKCAFTRALTVGSRGDDVMCLQKYLNSAGYTIAASGAGSPGNETTYFGGLTKAAVAKWQAAMGVSPAVGYFGSISRAKYDMTVVVAPSAPAAPGAPASPPRGPSRDRSSHASESRDIRLGRGEGALASPPPRSNRDRDGGACSSCAPRCRSSTGRRGGGRTAT